MSLFATTLIEDKILLTVTIIDALLLGILLLIAIRNATSAATSFAIFYCVLIVLLFLFVHDQIYTIDEPQTLEVDNFLTQKMAQSASTQPPAPPTQVYTTAVLLAIFSLVIILLILPPLFWHFRNRNVGATSLVAWIIVLLFATFVNAIIWPTDDTTSWFSGVGLCDVEVRVQVASQIALPASFAAVLRGLAAVLDTDHASVMQTKAQRTRNLTIDLLFCVGAPLLQVVFFELVHFRRYAIRSIAGCTPAVSDSWLTFLLISIPPLLWALVDAVYSSLILLRLFRYRAHFSSILATNQTTAARFLRLYLICCLWILTFLPISLYVFATRARTASLPFNWTETHDHAAYHGIFLLPMSGGGGGGVYWDRWLWLGTGICIFLFFGCGREAVEMYRKGLLAVGLGKVFPALRRERTRRSTTSSTISSIGSKARMLFKRKSSVSDSSGATWTSTTSRSHSRADEPVSPKTATFLEAIREVTPEQGDPEKAAPAAVRPSLLSRVASFFGNATYLPRKRSSVPVPLAQLAGGTTTVRSSVSAGQRPVSLVKHVRDAGSDVLVKKEVRQASVHEAVEAT